MISIVSANIFAPSESGYGMQGIKAIAMPIPANIKSSPIRAIFDVGVEANAEGGCKYFRRRLRVR
jgi:hypothetical protein